MIKRAITITTAVIMLITVITVPAAASVPPVVSTVGGVYDEPQMIILYSDSKDATIYYTLDGTIPGFDSNIYSDALYIDEDTVLRAVNYEGGIFSEEIREEYIINNSPEPFSSSNSSINAATASKYADEVIRLVNIERKKAGLKAYRKGTRTTKAAQIRAKELLKKFSHTRPSGKAFYTVFKEVKLNYRACAENIAKGQKTPAQVVTAWMNSSGHRKNILSSSYDYIGVSYYNGAWVQLFTRE